MLVLSRKLGERICVPHCGLTFTVLAIEGNRVRLGISAPADVAVYREEIWREILQQRRSPLEEEAGAVYERVEELR
jgi:carbon storage regulator